MLSRVAERVYWMARYMERLENTARMVRVYSHVMLDLPEGTAPDWDVLLKILSVEDRYGGRYSTVSERNVIKFMLCDRDNPGSLINSISFARENARTTREVFASDSWELINELYYMIRDDAESSLSRGKRTELLKDVTEMCQLFTGLQEGSLSHDQPLRFLMIGRNIERADMTSRLLDVAASVLLSRREDPLQFDDLLWMNILNAFEALQAYRLRMGPAIDASRVVEFILKDNFFPRSISYALKAVDYNMARLPESEQVRKSVNRLRNKTRRVKTDKLVKKRLHLYLDKLQIDIIALHTDIHNTWFHPGKQKTQ